MTKQIDSRACWTRLCAPAWLRPLGVCAVLWSSSAVATTAGAQQDAAADRATSFQAVEGAVTEDIPGGPLLVGAYALIWLGTLAYVWRLARLQRRGMEELAELASLLRDSDAADEGQA